MEKIFSCKLHVHGENTEYHVVFENEKYVFTAGAKDVKVPSFSLARKENEWVAVDKIDHTLQRLAINAIEKYWCNGHLWWCF